MERNGPYRFRPITERELVEQVQMVIAAAVYPRPDTRKDYNKQQLDMLWLMNEAQLSRSWYRW